MRMFKRPENGRPMTGAAASEGSVGEFHFQENPDLRLQSSDTVILKKDLIGDPVPTTPTCIRTTIEPTPQPALLGDL